MAANLTFGIVLQQPVLFRLIELATILLKLDIKIPRAIALMWRLSLVWGLSLTLIAAIVIDAIAPIYCFFILWLEPNLYNDTAIAAVHTSVNAVTFVTVSTFVSQVNVDIGKPMVKILTLIEPPTISLSLLLGSLFSNQQDGKNAQDNLISTPHQPSSLRVIQSKRLVLDIDHDILSIYPIA